MILSVLSLYRLRFFFLPFYIIYVRIGFVRKSASDSISFNICLLSPKGSTSRSPSPASFFTELLRALSERESGILPAHPVGGKRGCERSREDRDQQRSHCKQRDSARPRHQIGKLKF